MKHYLAARCGRHLRQTDRRALCCAVTMIVRCISKRTRVVAGGLCPREGALRSIALGAKNSPKGLFNVTNKFRAISQPVRATGKKRTRRRRRRACFWGKRHDTAAQTTQRAIVQPNMCVRALLFASGPRTPLPPCPYPCRAWWRDTKKSHAPALSLSVARKRKLTHT